MPTDPDRWPRVRALFEVALELPPAEREAWLVRQSDDAALLQSVRELLLQATDAGAMPWPDRAVWAAEPDLPRRLGAWEPVARLGSGGMGEVFEARRADGRFEGRAAVKLLRAGLGGDAVLKRFALEQQTLARLRHPHIAQLLDAGLSDDQRPYMVMELVRGRTIDIVAAERPLAQRLQLMLQLCDAVSHAHKNLLVHRDLKPGNVLVDDEGQVKLLDFGIAKAVDPLEAPGGAELTFAGQRPFTPAYASPEQVRGEPVSTATDVYSLGVLLYTLVTGQRPYGRDATTPAEAAQAVLDEPPRPASQVLTLPADLDRVLAKALRKDIDERYASVDALAADLRAWLAGYPVSARPAVWSYVAGKFVRRHRLGVSLATLGLLAMVALGGTAAWYAAQAQQALSESRRLASVMVFEVNDALKLGALEGRKALVKAASEFFDAELKDRERSPAALLASAEALERLADLEGNTGVNNLGDLAGANRHYAQAMVLYQQVSPGSAQEAQALRGQASVHRALARQQASSGDVQKALQELQLGFDAVDRGLLVAPQDPKMLLARCQILQRLVDLHFNQSGTAHLHRLDEALRLGQQQIECSRADVQRRGTPGALQLLSSGLGRMSALKLHAGRVAESVALARENVALLEGAAQGPAPMNWAEFLISAYGQLGFSLEHEGRMAESLAALGRSVEIARQRWQDNPADRRARSNFAAVSFTLGEAHSGQDEARAETACRESADALRAEALADRRIDEVTLYLRARRCQLLAQMHGRDGLAALPAIEGALDEARRIAPSQKVPGEERLAWVQLRLLRAEAWQRGGTQPRAFDEARQALQDMVPWEQANQGNAEYLGNAASLYEAAAALPWKRLPAVDERQRCDWARAAVQRFDQLAAGGGIDATLGETNRSARELAQRCGNA